MLKHVTQGAVGTALAKDMVEKKMKPSKSKFVRLTILFVFALLALGFAGLSLLGFYNKNLEFIVMPLFGVFGFIYPLLVAPDLQKSKNYSINLGENNTLEDFELYYKEKRVLVNYHLDEQGKLIFLGSAPVKYVGNSKMSGITRYKIFNYFKLWLNDNNLLSDKNTK